MEGFEALKKSRANSKRKITVLIRKFKSAIRYGTEDAKDIHKNLDEEYYRLLDIQLQVEEETEEEGSYMETIDKDYNEVVELYFNSEKESKDIENKIRLNRLGQETEETNSQEETEGHTSSNASVAGDMSMHGKGAASQELSSSLPTFLQNMSLNTAPIMSASTGGSFPPNVSMSVGSGIYSQVGMPQQTSMGFQPQVSMSYQTSMGYHPQVSYQPQVSIPHQTSLGYQPQVSIPHQTSLGYQPQVSIPHQTSLGYHPQVSTANQYQPMFASVSGEGFPQGPSMSVGPTLDSKVNLPQQMPMNYSTQVGTSMWSPTSFIPSSVQTYTTQPGFGHQQRHVIQTKKPSLPIFSGERPDWPEFKCVWRTLAEGQFANKMQLAIELKRCCKGRAAERMRHIYVTNDNAYDELWERLGEEYDDPGLSSQEAISRLLSLKPVEEDNYSAMVKLIDSVEGIHNQLRELGQLSCVHAVDVDRISGCLPRTTQMDWLRRYRDLPSSEKLSPFSEFVVFLKRERAAVARLAETMPRNTGKYTLSYKDGKGKSPHCVSTHTGQGFSSSEMNHSCAVHGEGHSTEDCRNFERMTIQERYQVLRKTNRCFNCFQEHPRDKCTSPHCKCGKSHHKLLCTPPSQSEEDEGK